MSQENVEIVRNLYGGIRDLVHVNPGQVEKAFTDYLDQEFELYLPSAYPEGATVFRGRTGIEKALTTLADAWGKWQFEPDRFIDVGDRVIVFVRLLVEGGQSGVPIELETTHVWTVRARRATSMHAYRDRSQALEAAGLRE